MLTIHYLPYTQVRLMKRDDRIELILSLLSSDKVIIIDGKLDSVDEASLIHETMNRIDDKFHGIELGVLHDHGKKDVISRVKYGIANTLTGRIGGLTIIGPASVISEMRQYPEDVILHFGPEYLKKHAPKKSNHKSTHKSYHKLGNGFDDIIQ